jgi:dihydrofolate synthase / folylpolyglutamate synthase
LSARYPTLAAALAWQGGSHGRVIDLSLERVREVARVLQLLHPACPVVTIAGTNGKGSTAIALAALLGACGQRVGLFASPHLVRYNERVQLAGVPVGDELLLAAFERIEAARGAVTLTFFEYSTLAALLIFRDARVDAIVLEVGLGGRLDATNIIDADVAVLCSVGFDHRDWLGDTLELIGAEKAGIFRPGRPVVLGSAQMPASVFEHARALDCPLWRPGHEFRIQIDGDGYGAEPWDYRSARCELTGLPAPALPGAIQYANAASALTVLTLLGTQGACDAAVTATAMRAMRLPGRLQRVPGAIEWILDVAHNQPAAAVLAEALAARPALGRTIGVASMLADKDAAAITRTLDGLIDRWILASLETEPRGLSAEALQARLPPLRGPIERATGVAAACAQARALARPGDRIVVFGSFHVVGPALEWLGLY